jgi:pimeloyl-ACP methyl ester carboxylesterase
MRTQKAPLVLIHGGPSLSSEYLDSISDEKLSLNDRSLVLYDQLGCGWSSIPQEDEWYGIENMAVDLTELLCHLQKEYKMDKYHLCGHSLGGAIGYEVLRSQIAGNVGIESMPLCLSFILSNASTNFKLSDSERCRLYDQFQAQQDSDGRISSKDLHENFFRAHICRTTEIPPALKSALTRRGKVWSANDYDAVPLGEDSRFPPVLIIRGEHDFITETCTSAWNDLIGRRGARTIQKVVMTDCAHYPHLEHPMEYAREIHFFCSSTE